MTTSETYIPRPVVMYFFVAPSQKMVRWNYASATPKKYGTQHGCKPPPAFRCSPGQARCTGATPRRPLGPSTRSNP